MHPPRLALVLMVLLLAVLAAEAATPVTVSIRTHKKGGKGWSTEMKYPQITGNAPAQGQRGFNTYVRDYVLDTVAKFEKDVKEMSAEVGPPQKDMPWQLWLDTDVPLRTDRWVSVVMKGAAFTGGAHPSPFCETVLYDVRSARVLKLGDVFAKGSGWLRVVSDIAIADLKKELAKDGMTDPEWLTTGAGPRAENYQWFFLSGRRLVVVFPPYQVAPYARGYVEVAIPFDRLRAIAAGDGPIR